MIIVELVDNETRERRYSDQDVMIKQVETGALYEDAVDVIPCKYTYEETDIPIEHPEPQEEPQQPQFGIHSVIPPMIPNIPDNPTTTDEE